MTVAALPYILAATSVVSAGVSYVGQRKAAKATESAANMNAAALEQQGIQEEQAARTRLRRLLASQRALYAKAGVDLTSGSPLTILADTAVEGEKEAINVRRGYSARAGVTRFEGSAFGSAGRTRAAGTLLSGLGRGAGQAYSAYNSGLS